MKIPLTKVYFDNNEEKAIIDVLRSGWVLQGPKVEKFEKSVKAYVGSKYAVAVSSGTTALYLSLKILGVGKDDEVILPSFTFIACANVVVQVGAVPVFADIDPLTFNIDPKDIEKKITKKTKAIMVVDQVGLPADLDEVNKICKKHKLFFLEDAACALGSIYKGKRVGSIADITCFSFHPRKNLTTGEGGMITTNNQKWTERVKVLRNHGIDLNGNYQVIGYNFRMTDIQASVGMVQLKKINWLIKKRGVLSQRYSKAFKNINTLKLPYVPSDRKTNWQSYLLKLREGIDREKLILKFKKRGVALKEGIPSIHLQPIYQKLVGKIKLSETEKASSQTLFLPLYPQMTIKEQDYVIDLLIKSL